MVMPRTVAGRLGLGCDVLVPLVVAVGGVLDTGWELFGDEADAAGAGWGVGDPFAGAWVPGESGLFELGADGWGVGGVGDGGGDGVHGVGPF